MITKKNLLLLIVALLSASPVFAQRFTKREQARREARAANYFYGASFTFTAGYDHSWVEKNDVGTSPYFGQKQYFQNTYDSFNAGFLMDYALSKKWGYQIGLYYNQKGCDKVYYYDNHLGQGEQKVSDEEIKVQGMELQGVVRYFIPLSYKSRISINAGLYLNKLIDPPATFKNWDMGVLVGAGYDWQHWSVSATYQPGVYPNLVTHSDLRMSSLMFNVGWRFWKK